MVAPRHRLVQLGRADAIVAMIIIGREITISACASGWAKIGASKAWLSR